MPVFGKRSLANLSTCDIRLQLVLKRAIKYFDFAIDSGHRSGQEQAKKVAEGRSKTMNSKHLYNPSLAVDISPYPIDWKKITKSDLERFCYLAGLIISVGEDMGIKLRWGRNWDMDSDFDDQTFNDYGHFEIIEEN